MKQQTTCEAFTTNAILCQLLDPAEDQKLHLHDFIVIAERVALTLSVCGLVHAVM